MIEHADKMAPDAKANRVWINEDSVHLSVSPRIDPLTHKSYELSYDQLILNPYTGEELGRRSWGAISQGMKNLMPFIYKLHYNLALDEPGVWVLGITALIWTLDCFIGFYLTFPTRKKSSAVSTLDGNSLVPEQNIAQPKPRSFLQRWALSWRIKWRGSAYRINFDLHRAGGLWLWLALLIFAWSSVYMNLADTAYQSVMKAVSDYHEPWTDFADLDQPVENPAIGWPKAYRIAVDAMRRAAQDHGIQIKKPMGMWINRAKGFYVYVVRSSADIQDRDGYTRIVIDANTGEQKLLIFPSGQYNGNTITSWLQASHMGNVFGMPYRIFVCLLGLAIVMLGVTGVVIWLRKRRSARHRLAWRNPRPCVHDPLHRARHKAHRTKTAVDVRSPFE